MLLYQMHLLKIPVDITWRTFFLFLFFEEVQEEEGEIKEIRSDKVELSQQNSEA